MATADQVYQTSISVNGKVDDALLKGIQRVDTETGKVVKQEKALGTESKKAFDLMGKGMVTATAKVKDFSLALKEMLIPLLGISVAFKGFQTVGDTIQTAIDKFRGAKEAVGNFQASLEALFGTARAGRVEEFDVAQQTRMRDRFTRIYGTSLFREAQLELNRAGIALGDEAFAGFIQTTAYLKRDLHITAEDATALARKIGMAYALPRGARPDREVLEMLRSMNINIDKFSKLSGPDKLRLIVEGMKRMHYVQERIGDAREKDNIELMRAKTEEGGLLVKIGEFWEKLQTKGELITQHLKNAFEEPFVVASEQIQKLLDGPMSELDKQIGVLKTGFREIFNPSEEDVRRGFRKLDSPGALFGNLTRAWNETLLPQLKSDWEAFIAWVQGQWMTLGKSDNPFLKGLHDNSEAIAKSLASLGAISWTDMSNAAKSLGAAAQLLVDGVNALKSVIPFLPKTYIPKSPAEAAELERKAAEFEKGLEAGGIPHATEHALGGIVNAPQVGLVGEAGPESIIPLRQDTNTLDILGATLSTLNVNPSDPNAWGHELFDALRAGGAGGFGGLPGGGGGGFGTAGAGGPIRAEAYGPSQGEYTHDTLYGPTGAHLVQGDYAVSPDLSAGHYLGQMFSFLDAGGNRHTGRYADASYRTSGHPNTRTIEEWNGKDLGTVSELTWMARGGIVSKRMLAWLGEAGKEAVIPLEGNRGKRALAGLAGGSTGHSFHFSPTINVSGVATSEVVEDLVEQLRNNFGRWMEDAAFEHERRSFS